MSFATPSLEVHPSVLISVIPEAPLHNGVRTSSPCRGSDGDKKDHSMSGSGFIIPWKRSGHTETLVITATSWLSEVIELKWSMSAQSKDENVQMSWRYSSKNPHPCFTVLMQGKSDSGVESQVVRRADLVQVCLMSNVFSTLMETLTSLSHWRLVCGESENGVTNMESMRTLVLSMACLTVLRLREPFDIRLSYSLRLEPSVLSVGEVVQAMGTPFGSFCPEVFFNCLMSGSVCKLLGARKGVFVADINLPPGCEGSLIFRLLSSHERAPHLLTPALNVLGIVMTALSSANGQPSGLSLVSSAYSILRALEDCNLDVECFKVDLGQIPPEASKVSSLSPLLMETVVAVCNGECSWGSGILLSPTLCLTCFHVVEGNGGISVVMHDGVKLRAEVIFSSSTPDYALLALRDSKHRPLADNTLLALYNKQISALSGDGSTTRSDAENTSQSHGPALTPKYPNPVEGLPVLIVGFGCQDPTKSETIFSPLVTRGTVSRIVRNQKGEPIMFLTTALALPGMSGGLVVERMSGMPLGMVVNNSRELESGFSYPRVNYCLPFTWILPPVTNFLSSADHTHLETLTHAGEEVAHIWKLQANYSLDRNTLVHSKL